MGVSNKRKPQSCGCGVHYTQTFVDGRDSGDLGGRRCRVNIANPNVGRVFSYESTVPTLPPLLQHPKPRPHPFSTPRKVGCSGFVGVLLILSRPFSTGRCQKLSRSVAGPAPVTVEFPKTRGLVLGDSTVLQAGLENCWDYVGVPCLGNCSISFNLLLYENLIRESRAVTP